MKRAAFFILLPTLLYAQEFRASITGQVTDSSNAAVADATVTVASVERNTSSQTVTNAAGRYLVQFLLPGHYTVGVEKSGFKKFQHTGITLEAADHVALDIALEIGTLSQNVTVTGA